MTLDPNWLQVAQVYATLSVAAATRAATAADYGYVAPAEELLRSEHLATQAETALRAAGVEG